MKISKYSIISFPITYIILSYTMFAIKYTSLAGTPPQAAFIDYFINTFTHLWHIKFIIALVIAIIVNIIIRRHLSWQNY